MPTSMRERVRAMAVQVTDDELIVNLEDGRTLHVPLEWFPRLLQASAAQRAACRLIGRGLGISWPDLDEDISVDGLLVGKVPAPSAQWDDYEGDDESPSNGSPLGRYMPSRETH